MIKNITFLISLILLGCSTKDKKRVGFTSFFDSPRQEFKISNERDTILNCQYGTIIKIPKHSLVTNSSNNDSIRLVTQEVYKKSAMIKAGLSTTSNDKLLESKGMLFIEAFHNQKEIVLKDTPIEISFASKIDKDYQLFYGDFNKQAINWTVDTITSHYQIIINHVLIGAPCGNCDYAYDTLRIDSLRWNRGYTRRDTIVTFSASTDTLPISDYEWLREASTRERIKAEIFTSRRFEWINCDRFVDFQDLTSIQVKVNKIENPSIFCVFKDYNTVVHSDSENNIDNVPIGELVSIIGIDFKGEDMYFDIVPDVKITKNMTVKLQMKKTDKVSVSKILDELDE